MFATARAEQFSQAQYRSTKILILDDDPDIRASLKDLIESENSDYHVETAGSVPEAMSLVEYYAPDLALIDIRLGVKNGLDLLPILKIKFPDIMCVIITGYKDSEYAVKALRHGADNYLYKPLDPAKLLEVIEQQLGKQKRNREQQAIDNRMRAVFEQVLNLVFVVTTKGEIIDVNDSHNGVLACDKSGAVDKKVWGNEVWNINPFTSKRIQLAIQKAGAGEFSQTEITINTQSGEEKILDMLVKPLSWQAGEVASILIQCSDITNRKEVEKRLQDMLYFDSLTHLPKSSFLDERFELDRVKANRAQQSILLAICQITNLFAINNELGYKTGCEVVVRIAERLRNEKLGFFSILRDGEDSFILITGLDKTNPSSASQLAEAVISSVSQPIAISGYNRNLNPALKLSMSLFDEPKNISAQTAHRVAQKALENISPNGGYHIAQNAGLGDATKN